MQSLQDIDFDTELARVEQETAVERVWMNAAGVPLFETDEDILVANKDGLLVRVQPIIAGLALRQHLRHWRIEHSNPGHPNHYSPPFLRTDTHKVLLQIVDQWQKTVGDEFMLSATSLVRSRAYQARLAARRALAITTPGFRSSHEAGMAFDIDACGFYRRSEEDLVPFNPRMPDYDFSLAGELRTELYGILDLFANRINLVDEFSDTPKHCFHIAVKPEQLVQESS